MSSFLAYSTTPIGKKLHRAAVTEKGTLFLVLNLDLTSFSPCYFILTAEEISRSILIHPAHADHYSTDFHCLLWAVPFPGWAVADFTDPCAAALIILHCLSLRLFQFFCIFWDEWQERTTENLRCGITTDLYSFLIIFYFLPNTSSCFICFLITTELTLQWQYFIPWH